MVPTALPHLAARIDLVIELVAIDTPPMVSTEGADIREGIIVQVEGRIVLVAEAVSENVNQPLPRARLSLIRHGCCQQGLKGVLGRSSEDSALGVLAHVRSVADLITVLLIEQSSDNSGSGIVHENFAGGLDESVEHRAELFLYEVSHVLAVVGDVVFHHACQHSAQRAGIVETVFVPQLPEISAGTPLLQSVQLHIQILVTLYPSWRGKHMHQFLHEVWTAGDRGGRDVGVWKVELFVEGLGLNEHLHEDRIGLAGLSLGVVLIDIDDVLVEVPQDMCSHNAYQQQQHQYSQLH